jgi:DNA polymerase-3 subunit epsilon
MASLTMLLGDVLPLTRPLIFLDVETHDKVLPEQARICELGFIMFYPDERPKKEWCSLVDPGVPISAGATSVHSITDADVAGKPQFSQLAKSLAYGFKDCDYGGYNVRFDLRVMFAEMKRAGMQWSYANARLLDPLRLWQIVKPRTLSDAVEEYLGRKPTGAHRALGDVIDAYEVAIAQLKRHDLLPRDIDALHKLCFVDPSWVDSEGKFVWVGSEAAISFGKHAGCLLKNLGRSYLEWICSASFSDEVKIIAEAALNGKFPQRQG